MDTIATLRTAVKSAGSGPEQTPHKEVLSIVRGTLTGGTDAEAELL